jgi:tRNA(adenine34) deaminase
MTESRLIGSDFMKIALQEAASAADRGEVPVGCVVVDCRTGGIVGRAGNRVEELKDPTAHAEMIALREATRTIGDARLPGCDLYVSLEPCPMCATAISFARIRRLYFGAYDEKGGGVENGPRIFGQPTCHHCPDVYGGIGESDAAALLKSFFAARR